jgi:hypothetical protein
LVCVTRLHYDPKSRRAYDLVFDACANGQPLKRLTIVEEQARECLAIDVACSIRSHRVISSKCSPNWMVSWALACAL